jgi:hypothetical protein
MYQKNIRKRPRRAQRSCIKQLYRDAVDGWSSNLNKDTKTFPLIFTYIAYNLTIIFFKS